MLPGVHRVRPRLAGGRWAEYWYAWRGGPRILAVTADSQAERDRAVAAAAADAIAAFRRLVSPAEAAADSPFVPALIVDYLDSAEYARLAPRTRADERRHCDILRRDLAELEIQALSSPRARGVLIAWRDRYKATPRTADALMATLSKVLRHAADRGRIPANPLDRWPRLYANNRADVIWTDEDLALARLLALRPFADALDVAALSGLREADLARLSWTHVGQKAITLTTGKSRGRRVVTIPVTPALSALLERLRPPPLPGAGGGGVIDARPVLTNTHGERWTVWGLASAMRRLKADAAVPPDQHALRAQRRTGVRNDLAAAAGQPIARRNPAAQTARAASAEGAGPLDHLRFHDLRGTAVTNFVRAGLPLADIALIVGWKLDHVERVARLYVTSEAVAQGMLERLRKTKA